MTRADIDDLYPLSPVQRGLLAHELAEPGMGHNLVQFVATLHGRIDAQAFHQAWRTVQARHACLRSSFVWEGVKQPLQVVHRAAPLPYSVESPTRPDWEERMVDDNRRRGFSLREAPLFSVTLVRLGERLHQLVWCYHHLLLDGWSSALVLREVIEEHEALASSRPSSLPPVAPYGRYLEWLRTRDGSSQATFWREALEGWCPAPRPSWHGPSRPAAEHLFLPGDLSEQLHEFLICERITVATVVHAVWALLLARRQGTTDVVFGAVSSGRPAELPGIERIVGPLVRMFPARIRLPDGCLGVDWLRGLQRHLQESDTNAAGASLNSIAGWGGVGAEHGLFDSILTIENYPDGLWGRAGERDLDVGDIRFVESTGYPLCLEAVPGERLLLRLPYDQGQLDPASVRAFLADAPAAFETLMAGASSTAAMRLLPEPPAPIPAPDATLTSRWQQVAGRHAGRVAVEYGDAQLSYAELDADARRLAHALRGHGVGREDRVVLLLERSHRVPAAMLGVLLAGGAYVPVEPDVPAAHLATVVDDCAATVAITSADLLQRFEGLGLTVVAIDDDARVEASEPFDPTEALPGQAAYVLYTSGSSGRPKGIVVTHRNVVRLFDATQGWFRFGSDDVWTWLHSYAFDFSVWEVFGALLHGGRLVVTPIWTARSPADLLALLEDRGVTVLNQTPTAFRMLVAEQDDGEANLRLRTVIFGGEALALDSVAPWFRRHGAVPQLVNMYGITETTVHVTYRALDPLDAELIAGNRIGVPIPDLEIHLLSPDGAPVTDGESGEICVAGPGLARGYIGAPGLTATRFVPDPFSEVPGARMYRSGDLGRRLPNGDLEHLGRIDRQIKVRAHRIEAGGVEAVLRSHPAVEDAFVAAGAGSGELTAWVTPSRSHAEPVRRLVAAELGSDGARLFDLPGGIAIFHVNRAETEFMGNEVFGSACYLRHGLELRDGDCVFDVGANIGVFSVWAHLQAPGVRVYAFEPIADTYRILDMNLTAHGVPGRAFQCAIGAQTGFTDLIRFPNASALSGSPNTAHHGREYVRAFLGHEHAGQLDGPLLEELLDARLVSEREACPVETLSAVVRRVGMARIDLLKIDVEGDEIGVLAGIDEEHWQLIGQLAIEVHDERSLAGIESSLRDRGFRVAVDQQPEMASAGLHMMYATRRPPSRREPAPSRPPVWRSPGSLAQDLKRHVAGYLPPYMVPTSLSVVAGFPLTRNGKIDAAGLADLGLRPQPARPGRGLGTAAERTMAAIWRGLLNVQEPGPDASFFELGGDSILCVQMLSQLGREGYRLSSRQVFELRTLGALAEAAQPSAHDVEVPRRRLGAVALTPIQRWFFSVRIPNRNHWNQAVFLELAQPVPPPVLQRALDAVASHHDAFRLRFRQTRDGWEQSYTDAAGPVPLTQFTAVDVERALAETHRGLDIEQGPTLRAALIEATPPRLLLVAHHLVIDAMSWAMVVEDLFRAVGAVSADEEVQLPEPAATYQQWADMVSRHERLPCRRPQPPPLPVDRSSGSRLESHTRRVTATLSVEETDVLRAPTLRAAAIGPGDVALAGAAFALSRWTGSPRVAVDVEGHGRDTTALDVTRTIGWFTQLRHMVLDVSDEPDPLLLISTVRRALERERGTIAVAGGPDAEVSFNYTGEVALTNGAGGLFRVVDRIAGDLHDPDADRPHLIDVEVAIVEGRLQSTWSYCDQVHDRGTIDGLVADYLATIRAIGLRARYVDDSRPTPLAFPLADLSSKELDRLLEVDPDPDDVYALTPGQQGILFHGLYASASDVYVNQFYWTFRGPFDVTAFREAWRVAVGRHPMLRTSFVHKGLRTPHQLVHRDARLRIDLSDWRAVHGDEQERRWRRLLLEHRTQPFDPTRGLMCLVVVRTGEEEHRILWNHHHLLIDGWCTGVVLRDVFAAYEALVGGFAPEDALTARPRPYRAYVEWRDAQDLSEAEEFWRAQLAEVPAARLLPRSGGPDGDAGEGIVRQDADDALCRALGRLQRSTGITPNTAVVGAWALVLSRLLADDDVLFGSTVSGRAVDLEGVEGIVGLVINTLPVRARVDPDAVAAEWLAGLQRRLAEAREFQHVSLGEIRRWCPPPGGGPLFDTAVVFENLPEESVLRRPPPGLMLSDVGSFVRNHFAFTVRTVPDPRLSFDALYDPVAMSHGWATELLHIFVHGLATLAAYPHTRLPAVSATIDDARSTHMGSAGRSAARLVTRAR